MSIQVSIWWSIYQHWGKVPGKIAMLVHVATSSHTMMTTGSMPAPLLPVTYWGISLCLRRPKDGLDGWMDMRPEVVRVGGWWEDRAVRR